MKKTTRHNDQNLKATLRCRVPVSVKKRLNAMANARMVGKSDLLREALLAWLPKEA